MMIRFIDRQPEYEVEAREVVRELGDRPHLLTRVEVRGTHFPHMAREAFIRAAAGDEVVAQAWFTDVAEDSRSLLGYFAEDVALDRGVLEFGYGADVVGRVQLERRDVPRRVLERERLPKDVVVVTAEFVEERLGG